MLFSSQSSEQLNTLSADLNAPLLQTTSTALLSTTSSGLIDPIQQSNLLGASSASLDLATTAGIIVGGSPDLSTDITSTALTSTLLTALTSTALISDGITVTIPYFPFSTEGGSTLDTATNLGSLTGTPQSITALFGVSSTSPNGYYRVTLGANSNFNLSMTGLTADADVQFLNSVGTEIASSASWNNHDEAINVSGLAAGDYYVRVYQYSGNTGFSLDLSSTPSSTPTSNLLPNEFDLETTINYPGTTQTGFISNTNTADAYHFSINGFYIWNGELPSGGHENYSNLTLSLTGLSADADMRIIRDVNHNGLADPGEEIVRSALGGTNSESIHLDRLEVGDYFVQVYQHNGATSYTLNLSGNSSTQRG